MDETRYLSILRHADLCNRKPVPWGSNSVWLVDLVHHGHHRGQAIYKPRDGETPLWDFPDGTLYRRECAAYLVARALGWSFIPATVIRDGPLGIGSVQRYVEHERRPVHPSGTPGDREQLLLIALFDYLTNNADRKSAHCLVDGDGRIWAIDHGLTFHRDPKQRTVLAQFFGQPLRPAQLAALRRWRKDRAAGARLRHRVCDLLAPGEIDDFFARLDRVLEKGGIPEGRSRGYWSWY